MHGFVVPRAHSRLPRLKGWRVDRLGLRLLLLFGINAIYGFQDYKSNARPGNLHHLGGGCLVNDCLSRHLILIIIQGSNTLKPLIPEAR